MGQLGYAVEGDTRYAVGWVARTGDARDASTVPASRADGYRGPATPTGPDSNTGATWPAGLTDLNAWGTLPTCSNTAGTVCTANEISNGCWTNTHGTVATGDDTCEVAASNGLHIASAGAGITYTAGAASYLGTKGTIVPADADTWTINHQKTIRNTQDGTDK